MSEQEPQHPNMIYLDERADAFSWLNEVGRYDHEIPKPDSEYRRSIDRVFRYLADTMQAGDFDTTATLANLERQAQQEEIKLSWDRDEEDYRNAMRHNQLYNLARTMNGYAESVTSQVTSA